MDHDPRKLNTQEVKAADHRKCRETETASAAKIPVRTAHPQKISTTGDTQARRLTVRRSAASRASVASDPSEARDGESAGTPCSAAALISTHGNLNIPRYPETARLTVQRNSYAVATSERLTAGLRPVDWT